MRVADVSLSKKVNQKISKSYKEAPIRTLENELDTEVYNQLIDDYHWNRAWQDFDADFNRQKYGLLWVNQLEERLQLMSLKGYESFTIRNQNTGELELVCLNYPDYSITSIGSSDRGNDGINQMFSESQDDTSANSRIYVFWTKHQKAAWSAKTITTNEGRFVKVTFIPDPSNPKAINYLGVLPFVFVSKQTAIDLPFINNITQQSIDYSVLLSDIHTASAMQGYGQMIVKLPEESAHKKMTTGMSTAIQLTLLEGREQQPDVSYINPSPSLNEMREIASDYINQVLGEHGISVSAAKDQIFGTALERLIAEADVQDIIMTNQSIYSQVEQDIYNITAAYSRFMPGMKVFKEQTVNVTYQKPKVMISDNEVLQNIKLMMDMGLADRRKALMILDPNKSEEEADAEIERIDEAKAATVQQFLGEGNELQQGQEEESQEEKE